MWLFFGRKRWSITFLTLSLGLLSCALGFLGTTLLASFGQDAMRIGGRYVNLDALNSTGSIVNNRVKGISDNVASILKAPQTLIAPTPNPDHVFPALTRVEAAQGNYPILMYHHIGAEFNPYLDGHPERIDNNVTVPADFEVQLQQIVASGRPTIFLKDLYNQNSLFPPVVTANSVVLTIDDGYRNLYTAAFPLLKKYNVKATVFIITSKVGGEYYVTWDMLREMRASGLVDVQNHTVTHRALQTLNPVQLASEFHDSRQTIWRELGTDSRFCAYPGGSYNAAVIAEAKKEGLIGCVTTASGKATPSSDSFTLPRKRISYGIQDQDFILLLN